MRRIFSILIVTVILWLMSICLLPQYKLDNHTVSIEALGKLNKDGLADGVQVQKVIIDGIEKDQTQVFLLNDWSYENNSFTWGSYLNVENTLTANIAYRTAKIQFLMNEWGGGVRVCVDGKEMLSKDMYRNGTGQYILTLKSAYSINPIFRVTVCVLFAFAIWLFIHALRMNARYVVTIQQILADVNRFLRQVSKRWKHGILDVLIIALLFLCMIENASSIYKSRNVTENIQYDIDLSNGVVLTEGHAVSQKVCIDAVTKGLALYFHKGEETKGHVAVSIDRDDKEIYRKVIYVQSMEDGEAYDLDIPDIAQGEYTITVSGMEGNDQGISVILSKQVIFEKAVVNGNAYSGNLALNLQTSIIPYVHYAKIILFALLVIVMMIVLYYVLTEKPTKHNIFYLCSIILTVLTICINFPCYSITPEFLWESGSDFYQVTYLRGIRGSFFVDDAGYWPLYMRLLADLIIHVFQQRKYALFLMQGSAVLFTAFVFGRICSEKYRVYADDKSRLAVSLFGGTAFIVAFGNECLCFHNFAYFGIILLILNMMLDFKKLSRCAFVFVTLESGILCLSKGRFGVIFPLFMLIILSFYIEKAICKWRHREYKVEIREIVYFAVASIGACIQIIYMLGYLNAWDTKTEGTSHTLAASFYFFVQSFVAVFLPQSDLSWDGWVVNTFFLAVIIFLAIMTLRNWTIERHICRHIAYAVTFTMGSCMLNAIMQNEYKTFSWSKTASLPINRTAIFMMIGAITVLLLCCRLIKSFVLRKLVFAVLLIIMSLRFVSFSNESSNCMLAGNWFNDYQQFENESYVVPLWSDRRFMANHAHVLYLGTKSEEDIDTSQWNYTTGPTEIETIRTPQSTSAVFETESLYERRVNAIYVNKVAVGMDSELYVALYDKNENLLHREKAMPVKQRLNLGFVFKEPVKGVAKIKFVNEAGELVEVRPELFIGVVDD